MNFPKQNPDLASQNLQGLAIVLDLARDRMLHEFNDVGTKIWTLCDGEHSVDEIGAAVIEDFDVTQVEATSDVQNFLEELTSKNLIVWNS